MLGCEQESLLPEQALADVQSDDFTWSAPVPESVTLTDIRATFINFENWRRQGLTWKRTQPNTLGSYFRDSGDVFEVDVIFLDRIQQVFVPGTGNITVASTINATVSRHAAINGAVDILTGGERINGSNGGTYVFDNEMLTGFFTPGTGAQWSMIYSLNDGTASVRWTDRGNQVTSDPMSTEFNCQ